MRTRQEIQAMLDALGREWETACSYSLLVVRAWVISPVAHDVIGHMPLDGLLEVATLNLLGISIDELGDMYPEPVRIPIPVRKVEMGGTWIYAASWARYHAAQLPVVRCKRKHFNESRFVQHRVIDTSSGKYRSYDLKTAAIATPYVEWSIDADEKILPILLPHLSSIGKDRNTGLGTVSAWEIDTTDRDPIIHEGVPQRAIPCPDGDVTAYDPERCVLSVVTVRPPYVWSGTRMTCVIPVEAS